MVGEPMRMRTRSGKPATEPLSKGQGVDVERKRSELDREALRQYLEESCRRDESRRQPTGEVS